MSDSEFVVIETSPTCTASSYHGATISGIGERNQFVSEMSDALKAWAHLKDIEMENIALVGTGISGVALASVISFHCGTSCAFIRKETDTKNHDYGRRRLCGIPPRLRELSGEEKIHAVLVDDFAESGTTLKKASEYMMEEEGVDISAALIGLYNPRKSDQEGLREDAQKLARKLSADVITPMFMVMREEKA